MVKYKVNIAINLLLFLVLPFISPAQIIPRHISLHYIACSPDSAKAKMIHRRLPEMEQGGLSAPYDQVRMPYYGIGPQERNNSTIQAFDHKTDK
jgi:hypothetical protein